jgi:TolA-binding protein
MSEPLFFTILSLAELAFVTAGLAVFLFFRYRRMSKKLSKAQSVKSNEDSVERKDDEINYLDFLRQNIERTESKLADLPQEQAEVLQTRVRFLQAEANAQQKEQDSDAFWNQLIDDLLGFYPNHTSAEENLTETPQDSDSERPILNELDDIDIDDHYDAIPTLEDHVGVGDGDGVRRDASITLESANEDMERLRKIITRQHNTMDALKKSLNDKDIDIESNLELSKKLEEVEVAQAQLNMCVETLEKENERLNELIKEYEESPHQEQLIQAKQDLEEANERITNLEKENTQQAERITELESEISDLQKQLEQRNAELSRLQSQEADLSQTNENQEQDQDSLMKEIENLTDLITQKSEELSKLQNENSPEFEFTAGLPELETDETPPGNVAKSG